MPNMYNYEGVMPMQIDRLLAMVPILLQQERVTAGELARRSGVSTRTVYRDALSLAGVPVSCAKGNGGISLLPEYTVDRSKRSGRPCWPRWRGCAQRATLI